MGGPGTGDTEADGDHGQIRYQPHHDDSLVPVGVRAREGRLRHSRIELAGRWPGRARNLTAPTVCSIVTEKGRPSRTRDGTPRIASTKYGALQRRGHVRPAKANDGGVNRRRRMLWDTTNTEERTIARPATSGLSSPATASGRAAVL